MRKKRQFKAERCYHLVSRIAHRAFFLDEEKKNRFVVFTRVLNLEGGEKSAAEIAETLEIRS